MLLGLVTPLPNRNLVEVRSQVVVVSLFYDFVGFVESFDAWVPLHLQDNECYEAVSRVSPGHLQQHIF